MQYRVTRGFSGFNIKSPEENYYYKYGLFSLSGTLFNSKNEVVATSRRKSWWSYSYEFTVGSELYTFKSGVLGSELVSAKTGEVFRDGYSTNPFRPVVNKDRIKFGFNVEINSREHAIALLLVECFIFSVVRW